MRATESNLGFWANALDGQGNPTLTIAVETETGKPVVMTIRDRESLETLAKVILPSPGATTQIGQALMLADAMKMQEASDRLSGDEL